MKAVLTLVALCAAVTTASTAAAGGEACSDAKAPILCETQRLRLEVWSLEDLMGLARTPTTYSDRASESEAYREWVRDQWRDRLRELKSIYDDGWGIINAEWPQVDEWERIAICETGGDWQWDSGTYQGGVGFFYGTWDQYRLPGYPSEAHWASKYQQLRVAERVYNAVGIGAWGCSGAA